MRDISGTREGGDHMRERGPLRSRKVCVCWGGGMEDCERTSERVSVLVLKDCASHFTALEAQLWA
jgi:hypothetical protein